MSTTEVLSMLSGDTTIMFELLADNYEIKTMARSVANNIADYDDLLELTYCHF
jgi:hypothetical protein